MTPSVKLWTAKLLWLALLALGVPGWASASEVTHSGTVLSVDKTNGTIVLEELGPWQVKDGKTVVNRQTIAVAPSTEFSQVKRATGAAPSGWIGGYVETPLPAWQVKPGDFVTISVKGDPRKPTAQKITLVDTTQP